MKKLALTFTLVAALVGVTAASASASAPSPDAGKVKIVQLGYNANGADSLGNRWQEYIDLKNVSGDPVNVKGWFTQDQWANNTYRADADASQCNTAVFAAATDSGDATKFHHLSTSEGGLWLPAGEYIRVYTGGNVDTSNNAWHTIALNKDSCGYHGHYLGNGGDAVYLKDAHGKTVAKFSFAFDNGYWVR